MYGNDFVNEAFTKIGTATEYLFDITRTDGKDGNDFNSPPVRVQVDFAQNFDNQDLQDTITRYSLVNRKIDVFIVPKKLIVPEEGKEKKDDKGKIVKEYEKLQPEAVGSFIFNTIDSAWDAFPVLTQHPLALKALTDICTAYHLKNLLPLQE